MSRGVDTKRGLIDLHTLLPERGDCVMIVNCGDHWEMREQHISKALATEALLTDDDIEGLKAGTINWH